MHAWSLAIEEKFYLLWPRAQLPVATAGILVTVGWGARLVAKGASEARIYYGPELRVDALLWGAALAVLQTREGAFRWLRHLARPHVFWTTIAAAVLVVAMPWAELAGCCRRRSRWAPWSQPQASPTPSSSSGSGGGGTTRQRMPAAGASTPW
ncbi:MAG: hypothetical protein ABL997_16890 [Planctomycetota bacterium]